MSITVVKVYNADCDMCGHDSKDLIPMPNNANKHYIRRELKNRGWTRKKVDGYLCDLCPECSNSF